MKWLKNIIFVSLIVSSLFIFDRCATIGHPTGGDRDTIPPSLVFTDPEMYSTNFDQKRVDIGFNEYVKLNKVEQELIISPPLEKKPKIWIKGKGIYFDLDKEKLVDSVTYIFNFGNSIIDNNEGNPFTNFSYIFSTGSDIDSFGISGVIIDAFTLKPSKQPFSIMLYDKPYDSIPYKEIPLYTSRSLEDGSFNIEHVKPGTYKIFALQEKNNNFIYDQKDEVIAFSDSVIVFDPENFHFHEETDTISILDTLVYKDSISIDSLRQDSILTDIETDALINTFKIYGLHHNFVTFIEESTDTLQYMKSNSLVDNKMLYFSFNNPVTDSFDISLQYFPDNNNWALKEYSENRDSINYWITDTSLFSYDTLNIIATYTKPDSLLIPRTHKDTIIYRFKHTREKKERKNLFEVEEKKEEKVSLALTFNVANNRSMELNSNITITTKTPIEIIDTSRIRFYTKIDTLFLRKDYEIIPDSILLNKVHFNFELEEDSRYKIDLFDSAFIDIYGLPNDTIYHNLLSKRLDQYGILIITMENIKSPVILQLLDTKETLIREKSLISDQEIKFEYLAAKDYILKIIFDDNQNGKWDTGNYLKKIQPEKVQYFNKPIKLRENWDHAETWDILGGANSLDNEKEVTEEGE